MRKISYDMAYKAGQQDAMYGRSLSDNPWQIGDVRAIAWISGWHNPQDQHERVYTTEAFEGGM